jgi:hypothetical protein
VSYFHGETEHFEKWGFKIGQEVPLAVAGLLVLASVGFDGKEYKDVLNKGCQFGPGKKVLLTDDK